jgi:hypothetical protein
MPLPIRLFVAMLALLPRGALAQEPLDAEAFDARTRGRTITYSVDGVPYGTEQYLPDRQVRWAFEGGECKDGSWFQDGAFICFLYEATPDLQCWTFEDSEAGLTALFQGDALREPLVSLSESAKPLICAGPDLGV